MSTEKSKANKPVKEFSDGAIKVAVWRNDGGDYGPSYSVTCRRRYKGKGDEWKDSYSYGQDDALVLSKLLDLAHTWMLTEHQQQRSQRAAA
jgi:hypothetical protein